MTTGSALYVGTVTHRRLRPRVHHFRYRAFWMLLDIDEIESLAGQLRFFSYNRGNLFALRDKDHGDGGGAPLRDQARGALARAGVDPSGLRIYLLCMPRIAGWVFNPLSVYFCQRSDGSLAAVIYEVHNTFAERHSYLFSFRPGEPVPHECGKRFYVSPFLDMDMRYRFKIEAPRERVCVAISVRQGPQAVLNAVLSGERRPLTDAELVRLFLTIPLLTLKVTIAIRWEALRLWSKGVRLRRRPAPTAPCVTFVGDAPAKAERRQ